MKTKSSFLVSAVVAIAFITGCMKKSADVNQLTDEQKVTLKTMTLAFDNAKVANDSLVNCNNPDHPHSEMMADRYDSCYHANDSLFTKCHASMMSGSNSMMSGNGGMMGGNNGGMMGNGNSNMMSNENSMCSSKNSELNTLMEKMKQLRLSHENYHPANYVVK